MNCLGPRYALAHKRLEFAERPTPFATIGSIEDGHSSTVLMLNDDQTPARGSFDTALYLVATDADRPTLFAGKGGKTPSRAWFGRCLDLHGGVGRAAAAAA